MYNYKNKLEKHDPPTKVRTKSNKCELGSLFFGLIFLKVNVDSYF